MKVSREDIVLAICRWHSDLMDTRNARKSERIREIIHALEDLAA